MIVFSANSTLALRLAVLGAIAGLAFTVGCGGEAPPPGNPPPPTALSLAEWKTLPIPDKYDGGTLDRLRMHDPALASDQAWDAFMRKEVIPERMKDIPGQPGVLPPEAKK